MKQLLDFLPLVIFFAVYKFYDIYAATGVLIAATAIQLVITYLIYKHIEKNAFSHLRHGDCIWFTHPIFPR